MAESFNYIESHDDSQFALKELRDVLTGDPEEERLRIVEAAAAIIREDIRSSVVEIKSYSPPSKILIKENQKIPKYAYCIVTGSSRFLLKTPLVFFGAEKDKFFLTKYRSEA
ncbi:hypothetical protein TNCV_769201 [Trichonephila clavipes]|nr:hypothetical protein TNCV_769201 [Trichonephila clavipes]